MPLWSVVLWLMVADVLAVRSGREKGVSRAPAGVVDLDTIVLVADGAVASCRAVTDGLAIVIGRVIRLVLGERIVVFPFVVWELGALEAPVGLSVIVVVGRGVRSMPVILAERVVFRSDVVGVERVSTTTGRVMRVVLDGLMV